MDDIKSGRSAGFTKPITSKLNYKQDASSLYEAFGKSTLSKEAAQKAVGYADLLNEFEEKYVGKDDTKLCFLNFCQILIRDQNKMRNQFTHRRCGIRFGTG